MNTTPEMDAVILRWTEAKTERERAQLEVELWRLAPRSVRGLATAQAWLCKTLAPFGSADVVRTRNVDARQRLQNGGDVVGPVWDLIDGPEHMTLQSGARILSSARQAAKINHTTVEEEVAKAIKSYLSLTKFVLGDGRTFRRMARDANRLSARRDNWGSVRAAIKRIVYAELDSIADANAKSRLRSQIEVEISSLVHILTARVRRVKETASLDKSPARVSDKKLRQRLREACQLLSVDAPAPGHPVDLLTYQKAKKNYRSLVKEYHPDTSGTEDTRESYQAVIDAMILIEQNFQNSATTTSNKDVSNG